MKYLGLDLGTKTLGLSISDNTNTIASTYSTLRFEAEKYEVLIEELKKIIKNEGITILVLGYPKNMNNSIGERAKKTLDFKKLIEEKLCINVLLEDERLTSVISNNILIKADVSRKKRKTVVDGMAASIILQSYLDRVHKEKEN